MSFLDKGKLSTLSKKLIDGASEIKVEEKLDDVRAIVNEPKGAVVVLVTEDKYFNFRFVKGYGYVISANPNLSMPKDVALPSSYLNQPVFAIEVRGFAGVSTIESITIPSSIVIIGNEAFFGCKSLAKVFVNSTNVVQLGVNVFLGTSQNLVIYVPSSQLEAYKVADNWSLYADKIKPMNEPGPVPDIAANNGIVNVIVPTIVDSKDVSLVYNAYFYVFNIKEQNEEVE